MRVFSFFRALLLSKIYMAEREKSMKNVVNYADFVNENGFFRLFLVNVWKKTIKFRWESQC